MLMNSEVRTIEGKDYDDCREKLFSLYGKSFNTQDMKTIVKPGFLGFGQKTVFKVWYTVKDPSFESDSFGSPKPKSNYPVQEPIQKQPARYSPEVLDGDMLKNRDALLNQLGGGAATATNFIQVAQMEKNMTSKISELDDKLNLLVEKTRSDEAHPTITRIIELLDENEFSSAFIKKIKNRLTDELTLGELEDFDEVQKTVVDWIGNMIKIAPFQPHRPPHVIIIVGPTGVGKTTTIAKFAALTFQAAKEAKRPKPSIHMLTIDNMRVGAKEQLQKYADIFESPLDTAETPEEVKQIYDRIKDTVDILLIDTSGFSPNDSENIGKMRKILNVNGMDADVYLAFDATKNTSAIKSVMQNFEPFGYDKVIVTKCDETEKFGGVLSAITEKNKAVAFIADGQKAHKNLSQATKQYFLKRLYNFKIDSVHLDDLFPEDK